MKNDRLLVYDHIIYIKDDQAVFLLLFDEDLMKVCIHHDAFCSNEKNVFEI
jgi:hypothetical protein